MAPLLSISEAASLGMHALALLAGQKGRKLSARQMADRLKVSGHHLAKIMQRLVRAGLVESMRGPRGGFKLARRASSITLLSVYEAVEGALPPTQTCLLGKPACQGRCLLGGLVQSMGDQVREYLAGTTLEGLGDGFVQGIKDAPAGPASLQEVIS